MSETALMLEHTAPWCQGEGVDFGCSVDPHPAARVLVDADVRVHHQFHASHEVHIRDINASFDDWRDRRFDFVYSSHLLEHLVNPHAWLRLAVDILKPGGRLVLVLPCEDFYWPNGHPHANPDHRWWHLNSRKVSRWIEAAARAAGVAMRQRFVREATAAQGGEWGFVLVYEKA